jgi:hypothetical protein
MTKCRPGSRAGRRAACRPAAAPPTEHGFRLFQVGQQAHAALVIRFAVERGRHLPRRALQQAHAQARLELLDGVRDGSLRIAEVMRRLVKLRNSTMRVKMRIASNRSMSCSIVIPCCTV